MIFQLKTFKAGVLGGLIMTVGLALIRAVDNTPLNYELALGNLMTTGFDPLTWIIGFATHLLISGSIALLYGLGFMALRRSNWAWGTAFGVLHWAVDGLLMGVAPAIFSLIPELVSEPGFFAVNFGTLTVFANFVVHLFYGATVGGLYSAHYVPKERKAVEEEQRVFPRAA